MTYIVGLNLFGTTALIADTCVTTTTQSATSTTIDGGIKSGYLFPHGGAIYAYSGNINAATDFIGDVKRHLGHSRFKDDLDYTWQEFRRFIEKYRFPSKGFTMLLSTRHTGVPQLYQLSSTTGSLNRCDEQIVTVGTGKYLIDGDLAALFHPQIEAIIKADKGELPASIQYPYIFCTRLMELTCGAEYKALRRDGVGGFFHFTAQHADREFRQSPTLHLIVRVVPQERMIAHLTYHVRFATPSSPIAGEPPGDILITASPNTLRAPPELGAKQQAVARSIGKTSQRGLPNDTTVHFDVAVWPTVAMLQQSDFEDIAYKAAANPPNPYYLGVGFADRRLRPAQMATFSKDSGGLSDANPMSGETLSSVQQFVAEICGTNQDVLAPEDSVRYRI